MISKMNSLLTVVAGLSLLAGCAGRPESDGVKTRAFPMVEVPGMITDPGERLEYMTQHYWDAFFEGDGPTDSSFVLGVAHDELERSLSGFIGLVDRLPMASARLKLGALFAGIEERQAADTSSLVYLLMTEMVSRYLYDPNSPLRSEDLYLPFVEGLASSRFTSEDRRPGYEFEARMCRLNPYGSVAPDFRFKDIAGRVHSLHGVKADYTMLFFSNPGCRSCRDIVDAIEAAPFTDRLIAEGRLSVVNVYIDEDVAAWKEYASAYPADWVSGYDYGQRINSDGLYYVRAIPSLYLLDSDKRVLYKDVPVERALYFLDNLTN